jgi:acyl-CoA synthetase (NDP forming)/RimJ/RimL family protein N-acetyltransferase
MALRSLRQLVEPKRIVAVAPVGATPAWALRAERNLFAATTDVERYSVGTAGAAPSDRVTASLDHLPAGPFLALVSLPQPNLPALLDGLHAQGCRAAVLVGGTMPLPEREALQARARRLDIRLLGPTQMGLLLPHQGLSLGAAAALPPKGELAFLAQSDALTTAMLDWAAARNIGFSLVASLGDSMEVKLGDLLDHLALDPATRIILLQLEGISDAHRFMSAARAAARTKPVIAIRSGRYTALGDDHDPARLRAHDDAYEAAFRRAGMLRVRRIEELFATAGTLAASAGHRRSRLRQGRLAILSNGRGPALLAADLLAERGEGLAHSVDLGLEATPGELASALRPCLRDPACDAVLVLFAPGAVEPPERYAQAMAALQPQAREAGRLLLAAWLGEATVQTARRLLAEAGVPTYASPEAAVQAFLDIVSFKRRQLALQQVCPSSPRDDAPERATAAAIVQAALATGPQALLEPDCRRLLAAYDLPPVAHARPVAGSIELVLAMSVDPAFGPVLRLAQGAPGRVLIGEAATSLPPLNRDLAMAMLQETPLGRTLLAGGDRQLPEPRPVIKALVRLSQLIVDRPEIAGIELELRLSAERGLETQSARIDLAPIPPGTDPTARLASRPYPVELEEEVTTEDGQCFTLRPIRPEDAAALQRGFRRLTADDVRRRFFAPIRELTAEAAARLSQIDYDRELVLEDPASPGDLLGGARIIMDPDRRCAEFAATIRSDQQGRGLGRLALERVLDHARRRGVEEVWGSILADNQAMQGLATDLGLTLGRDPDQQDPVIASKRLVPA